MAGEEITASAVSLFLCELVVSKSSIGASALRVIARVTDGGLINGAGPC